MTAIEKAVRREFNLPSEEPCEIEFLVEGAFNKVYLARCALAKEYIVRVTSPVQPRFKTMSEDASIKYIRYHTNIPAPTVLKCSPERDAEPQFEYMIMDRVPGTSMGDSWHSMSWLKKEMIVRQVVSYLAQLFERWFSHIGSLYATSELQKLPKATDIPEVVLLGANVSTPDTAFCLSRIVSIPFFWGKHIKYDVPRGPFKSTREYLAAEIQLHLLKWSEAESPESDSDSDCEELAPEAYQTRAKRLLALLTTVFPEEPEEFVLHHSDANEGNIFIGSHYNLSGLPDWECIHTVPTFVACEPSKFLYTYGRDEMADPANYSKEIEEETRKEVFMELYFERLEEYEKTQLRQFFIEEMQRVCSERVQELPKNRLKAAFVGVVGYLGEAMWVQLVDEWVTKVEKTSDGRSIVTKLRGAAFWN